MIRLNFPKNRTLQNATGMPQMSSTLNGWQVTLTLRKIIQNVNSDGDFESSTETYTFQGVLQPLRDEKLELKPEGQRSWEWIWIHAVTGSLNLDTADKVIFNQKRYKVMNKKDYTLNGFVEYELVRDYEDTEIT